MDHGCELEAGQMAPADGFETGRETWKDGTKFNAMETLLAAQNHDVQLLKMNGAAAGHYDSVFFQKKLFTAVAVNSFFWKIITLRLENGLSSSNGGLCSEQMLDPFHICFQKLN